MSEYLGYRANDDQPEDQDNIEDKWREDESGPVTEYDNKVMREGLSVLANYLIDLPSEKLPATVLFPETSARPLVYLVRPLFRYVYANQHLN